MYVLKNVDSGKFVAPKGHPVPYVVRPQDARMFIDRVVAKREAWPDEVVQMLCESWGTK